jgi:hypothetical protein
MLSPHLADSFSNKTETKSRRPRDGGRDKRCRFIVSSDAAAGRPRFCAAPALPGSAYCRHHHLRCAVDPATAAGERARRAIEREADRAADLPPELAHLSSIATPELDSADAPDDIAACLDLGIARRPEDE